MDADEYWNYLEQELQQVHHPISKFWSRSRVSSSTMINSQDYARRRFVLLVHHISVITFEVCIIDRNGAETDFIFSWFDKQKK
jgi:hypothetical protein